MYYFYINFKTFKDRTILIHHGDCGHCKNGNGMFESGSNEKGFWAGPFKELSHADEALNSLIKLFNYQPEIGRHSCCQ